MTAFTLQEMSPVNKVIRRNKSIEPICNTLIGHKNNKTSSILGII